MTFEELLKCLGEKDIELRLEQGRLRYSVPEGGMTPELRAELGHHKPRLIDYLRRPGGSSAFPSISSALPNSGYPFSYSQRQLWFHHQLYPGSLAYHMQHSLCLQGVLDSDLLERSLRALVCRHESLHTVFSVVDGLPVAVIKPEMPARLNRVDLRGDLGRILAEEAAKPFDLSAGPLFRFALFRSDEHHHVLAITLHHIIADGWSMGIFFAEMSALYSAYLESRPDPLPPMTVQFSDFARWQHQWLRGEILAKEREYWRSQLEGAPALLNLPADYPRPSVASFHGQRQTRTLPPRLEEAIKGLSQRQGATLFMTLLAAFKVLLMRYTGQDDIVVGAPFACRSQTRWEGLIGFFANTVVLRTDLSGAPPFTEVLARLRKTVAGALAHQDFPFEMLVESICPHRTASYNPVFQVMFDMVDWAGRPITLPGITVEPLPVMEYESKFDLNLTVHLRDEGLQVVATYRADLFDDATIRRLLEHYEILLESITDDPRQSVALLPMLSAPERDQLLHPGNESARDFLLPDSLFDLFERQAHRTPDALALEHGPTRLSYGELHRRADQLACSLQQMGVKPGMRIGLCLERSVEMIIGLLAVLKVGGAYVPMNPGFPHEQLTYIMEDIQSPLLLTQQKLLPALSGLAGQTTCLDAMPSFSGFPVISKGGQGSGSIAYIIYTSGSTGRPKGVMVSHRAALNYVAAANEHYQVGPGDRVLQFAAINFDASVEEVFCTLTTGATLVLRSEEMLSTMEVFLETCRQGRITVMSLPTAFWHELAQSMAAEPLALPPSLRLVIIGGERALADRLAQWRQHARPEVQLINTYGPTEAAVVATVWPAPSGSSEPLVGEVPIGRPLSNVQAFVLDSYKQLVPRGVVGELCLGGAGLAEGYLNQPELTQERFIPHPFRPQSGERLYRTGDLARYRPDGNLVYCGRLDDQVKIRGFRVELGEVEAVLRRQPGVADAVVTVHQDQARGKVLIAYLVPKPAGPLDLARLRSRIMEALPAYMVPASFVLLNQLPLNRNGKVNRNALPAPDFAWLDTSAPWTAPRTATEEELTRLLAELFGLPRVGIYDNFFELGGNSLMATRMVSRLRKLFQVDYPLRLFFADPTAAGLAENVDRLRGAEPATLDPSTDEIPVALKPAALNLPPVLSFAQQRLWFWEQLTPGSPVYHMSKVWHLTGPLNRSALERSLNEIVRRHSVLRSRVEARQGQPILTIAPESPLVLDWEEKLNLPGERREPEIELWFQGRVLQSFDLARGPVLRASLLRFGAEDHFLLLAMHHMVSDAWSIAVLSRELQGLYEAYSQGRPSPLPEMPLQYTDYARWQREWLQGSPLEKQLAYWKRQLAPPLPVLRLPIQREGVVEKTHRGTSYAFSLPGSLLKELHRICRAEGTTLFVALLAGFKALLFRYTGQGDSAVGTPIAGRNHAELEPLIGLFVNTLVLRTAVDGKLTFRQMLARVKEAALGAYEHQDLPFDKLVEEINPQRRLGQNPLFQVMFVLQNAPPQDLEMPGLTAQAVRFGAQSSLFDLTLTLEEGPDTLQAEFEYSTDLFERSSIEQMAGHYQTLLAALVHEPERPLRQLPLLCPSERQPWLAGGGDRPSEGISAAGGEATYLALWRKQVERAPEAVAVCWRGQSWSYGELDRRASQLGHYLQQRGVGPEAVVGVCLERSWELMVALLGVWKAGGAYLPLDPGYPADRLAYMLQDSGVRVVISTRKWAGVLADYGGQMVELDEPNGMIKQQPFSTPVSGLQGNHVAYVIYTSGSTGRPKGVAVTQANLAHHNVAVSEVYALEASDRVGQCGTVNFDLSVEEIFPTWLRGAQLVLWPEPAIGSGRDLAQWVEQEKITVLNLPTAYWHEWASQLNPGDKLPPSLRLVVIGGEKAHRQRYEQWRQAVGDTIELINTYGPTEGTVTATWHRAEAQDGQRGLPLGQPLAGGWAYVLDERMEPVAQGMTGELYLGGHGVARGYWRSPELTAERFVCDPLRGQPGARMYRTGDLARWGAEGRLEYVGRTDRQVKVRGYRLELEEIEAALATVSGVREGAVILQDQTQLVGYWVGEATERQVIEQMRSLLPEYMMPGRWVHLPAMPLTPGGKLDRQRLPEAPNSLPAAEANLSCEEAPSGPVEEVVAGVWAEVLGLETVGRTANFFKLGGHSLLAMQVVTRLERIFEVALPLRRLFEAPTVAGLAAMVDGLLEEAMDSECGAGGDHNQVELEKKE